MSEFIDSHSHLADPRLDSPGDQLRLKFLTDAKTRGIAYFLQGGVGPEDWDRQLDLQKRYPEIWPVFGLHPYWVAEHSEEECEQALDQLAKKIHQARALGETGLDFRPHIAKDSEERQISCFEKQLELAEAFNRSVVLHLVQAHDEALRVLDLWGVPTRGGLVHSFNGSAGQAEEFLQRGLFLSIGGPVARAQNQRLHQAVSTLPLDRLLLETDSPDQPGDRYKDQLNPPVSLIEVAEAIGRIKKLSAEEILDISSQNLRKLLAQ